LGLLYIEMRHFEDAARLPSAAVERGVTAITIYACLGQTLYLLGDFSNASAALEKAARACPEEARVVQKYAHARLTETMIEGSAEEAIAVYHAIAGRHAEDLTKVCRMAFQSLCGYGRKEAAIRLGEALLDRVPDDPVISYHLDALRGQALTILSQLLISLQLPAFCTWFALESYPVDRCPDAGDVDIRVAKNGSMVPPRPGFHDLEDGGAISGKPRRERMTRHVWSEENPGPLAKWPKLSIDARAAAPRENAADLCGRLFAKLVQHCKVQRHLKPLVGLCYVISDRRLFQIEILPLQPKRITYSPPFGQRGKQAGASISHRPPQPILPHPLFVLRVALVSFPSAS
jgi:tetratricopeptide (TPR) repeat protein